MIAKQIFDYYFFGTSQRYLQDAEAGWRIHDTEDGLYVLENLKGFLKNLDRLGLQVTKRAASGIQGFTSSLEQLPADSKLTADQALKLTSLMNEVRTTLDAELKGLIAYVVTPKRYEAARLLDDIPELLSPGTFNKLPEISRYDLSESGKCIAFERPTAAAFHLLRATESALREYYCTKVKRGRSELMWGPMLQSLRKRRDMRSQSSLLNNLDDIRLTFRNPTQHPEKIYDIHEVQDLLGRCTDALNRMAKELPETMSAGT